MKTDRGKQDRRADLRARLIEAHYLRLSVQRADETRRAHPDTWRRLEQDRRTRNQELTDLNRQLRAVGCRPVALDPSLALRVKKLQRLEARNRAETATIRGRK